MRGKYQGVRWMVMRWRSRKGESEGARMQSMGLERHRLFTTGARARCVRLSVWGSKVKQILGLFGY